MGFCCVSGPLIALRVANREVWHQHGRFSIVPRWQKSERKGICGVVERGNFGARSRGFLTFISIDLPARERVEVQISRSCLPHPLWKELMSPNPIGNRCRLLR